MRDLSDEQNGKTKSADSQEPQDALNELRKLLLKPIQAQLDDLQRRLDTPDLHAKDISRVLPEAIFLRSQRDKKIEMALEPITEETVKRWWMRFFRLWVLPSAGQSPRPSRE